MIMRRRLSLLLLIALLAAALPTGLAYAEGGSHGEDARSPSMSADTGEEPIPDMSVTQDPGAEDGGVLGELFGDSLRDVPWRSIGMYACAALLLIIMLVIIAKIIGGRDPAAAERRREQRRKKKPDRGYKGRH